jgi:anaerobic ribonucleoside-triphosphate reductase activating protein
MEEEIKKAEKIRIFLRRSPVSVLGLGKRAVIWVQGCTHACKGCIVPESWDADGGEEIEISELATWILEQPDLEGITFSGGEPMMQAEGIASLIETVRSHRDLGILCYTGYRLEYLQQHGNQHQQALLDRLDLLIDGLYVESLHGDLLWRGSTNQRLLPLSDRYRQALKNLPDRSAGLEIHTDPDGSFFVAGVPQQPNFRDQFASQMRDRGVTLTV